MKLEDKVKDVLERFIKTESGACTQDDGHHTIQISEPELGHIIIDIKEHRMGGE